MRIGQNPGRLGMPSYKPQHVGIASLVYIPHTDGYYANSLDILKIQIDSLHAHTGEPFDLLVFDNGSSPAVQKKLQGWQEEGIIDWLFLSKHNLGKTGALNWILGALPNEIIGYTDSDIYFRQGWLQESLKVLEADPRAGLVTGQPCFADVLRGESKAEKELIQDPGCIHDYWPEREIVEEFSNGLGGGQERLEKYLSRALKAAEFGASRTPAVIGASHLQFILRRKLARQVIPLPATQGLSPEEDRIFNQRIDEAGFLHLSLLKPYVVHLGNNVDEKLAVEIRAMRGEQAESIQIKPAHSEKQGAEKRTILVLRRLARTKWIRRWLTRVYNALFKALSKS